MGFLKKIAALAAVPAVIFASGASPFANVKEVSAVTQTLSDETIGFYEQWKGKYLAENTYVTDEKQYYVWYSEDKFADAGYTVPVTVSEAHGYGMLITASMAEYDSEAKEIFDGLYRFYRAHLSGIGPNLMAWQQGDNGEALININGEDSAADGDMDIAYALLMADSVWGSDGDINYKQTAVDVINDIMTYEVNKTDWIIRLGDWTHWSKEGDKYYTATRPSDFIVQYMPVFAEASGDDRWMNVYESTYDIINSITAEYNTGLLPDFVIKDDSGRFVPAPAYFLESENDGNYYYNSCRTPWRISMDYLINGNEDALAFAESITAFMSEQSGGDPWEIKSCYTLDGTLAGSDYDYNDLCFTAPFMVAAACTDNTQWHDSVRDVALNYGDDVYYGDTIKMLCLIADDGGWIVPGDEKSEAQPFYGDANDDKTVDVADAVYILQAIADPSSDEFTRTAQGEINADCHKAGNGVDAEDALAILKFKANIVTELPSE